MSRGVWSELERTPPSDSRSDAGLPCEPPSSPSYLRPPPFPLLPTRWALRSPTADYRACQCHIVKTLPSSPSLGVPSISQLPKAGFGCYEEEPRTGAGGEERERIVVVVYCQNSSPRVVFPSPSASSIPCRSYQGNECLEGKQSLCRSLQSK